jgi:hypothetical protein
MTQKRSQLLMYIEVALVLLPVTLYEVVAAFTFIDLYDIQGRSKAWFLVPCLLMLMPLMATWRLCIGFASRGTAHAQSLSRGWWFLATAGAGVPLIGMAAILIEWSTVGVTNSAQAYLRGLTDNPFGTKFATASAVLSAQYAVWVAPVLLPLIHLWWEDARHEETPRRPVA